MRHVAKIVLGAGLGVALLSWAVPHALADSALADLRVDANRDGRVDVSGRSDERGEDRADIRNGALFLANLDDDSRRCKFLGPDGKFLPEEEIIACRDGADTVVNGEQDAEDLASIRSVPVKLPSGSVTGTATVTGPGAAHTHLFIKRGTEWQLLRPTDSLTRGDLERGLELGIEATDMVRDAKVWDGRATVKLSISAGGKSSSDSVTLRTAPVLVHDHTQQAQQMFATRISKEQAKEREEPELEQKSAKFIADLTEVVTAAGMPAPIEFTRFGDEFPQDFFEAMYTSIPAAGGKPHGMRVLFRSHQEIEPSGFELYERLRGPDVGVVQLADDGYEAGGPDDTLDSTGNLETIPPYSHNGRNFPMGRVIMGRGINKFTSTPGGPTPGGPTPGGEQPATPGGPTPGGPESATPGGASTPSGTDGGSTAGTDAGLAPGAGAGATPAMNAGSAPGVDAGSTPGTDAGTAPSTDAGSTPGTDAGSTPTDAKSASGNKGNKGNKGKELMDPSPAVQTFLRSQGLQDPLLLDSSWTAVQHVDEFIQFLPADTPRGWRVAIADPDGGMKLMRDAQAAGHGKDVFEPNGTRLKTIDDFLNDPEQILARDNKKAARKIAENLALVKRETGVTESEVIRVPALFGTADLQAGDQTSDTFESPMFSEVRAAINGVVLGRDHYLSTNQDGSPVIDGKNIFADAVTAAYGKAGMKVTFIDGSMFHGGEIHCGTNVLRDASTQWWRRR
jgi:Protein-arginine deiminase (PAD)